MLEFDYIISNPPYKGKAAMHQKIFNHCVNSLLKDEGTICFLQPDTPYTSKLSNKRLLENLKMMDKAFDIENFKKNYLKIYETMQEGYINAINSVSNNMYKAYYNMMVESLYNKVLRLQGL